VTIDILDYAESTLVFIFHDVPVAKLDDIAPRLRTALGKMDLDNFDVSRMRTLVHKTKLDFLLALESEPNAVVANETINYMLYGSQLSEAS
jgi:hypothetical protein